jgi:general secretion pathway protein K
VSLVERALPFVTVYSGRPQINVLDAMPEVLAALPGMTPADLKTFLAQREVAPDKAKTLLPNEAQQFVSFEGGKAIRVVVQVAFDTGHKENAEVVILILENGEQPYAILSWQDGSNQMVADGRP